MDRSDTQCGASAVARWPRVFEEEMFLTDVATAADSDKITGGILKIAGVVVLGAIM